MKSTFAKHEENKGYIVKHEENKGYIVKHEENKGYIESMFGDVMTTFAKHEECCEGVG